MTIPAVPREYRAIDSPGATCIVRFTQLGDTWQVHANWLQKQTLVPLGELTLSDGIYELDRADNVGAIRDADWRKLVEAAL